MSTTRSRSRSRSTFARDAAKYAATCGEAGADWDAIWLKIVGGYELSGLGEPTIDENQAAFEAWNLAYVDPKEGGAAARD